MGLAHRLAVVLPLTLAACASHAGPQAPDAIALASADARLQGAWRLRGFRPEKPLDAMSQAFIALQTNNLTVRFAGGRFVAEAAGVHVDRAYRIIQADGDQFRVVSYDEQGVPYDAVCTFTQPDTLEINSWSEPWRGVATLTRDAPWNGAPGPLPALPGAR